MGWSLKLGRVFGTRVDLHWSTLAMLLFYLVVEGGPKALAVTLVFFCVLLHEFGHIFCARAFGIGTNSVILTPIGGLANLDFMPKRPYKELLITLAGPAVNLVLAAAAVACGAHLSLDESARFTNSWLNFFAVSNAVLFAFNLLPIIPMDGGRVLRSLLAMVVSYERATVVAGVIGAVFAGAVLALAVMAQQYTLAFMMLIILGIYAYHGYQMVTVRRRAAKRLSDGVARLGRSDVMARSRFG